MKTTAITMTHDILKTSPVFTIQQGYSFSSFKEGDENAWAKIETACGEFKTEKDALNRFKIEFQNQIKLFEKRSLFLLNSKNEKIGTATAWYNNDFNNKQYGRIHWVAIHPDYQKKYLARPLISATIQKLLQYHKTAYLKSQISSPIAIKLYLDFGFIPHIITKQDRENWKILTKIIIKRKHNILLNF